MGNKKKPMIEYLEIDEIYYIENDRVKLHFYEGFELQQGTWDEVWGDALKKLLKAKEYCEKNNPLLQ